MKKGRKQNIFPPDAIVKYHGCSDCESFQSIASTTTTTTALADGIITHFSAALTIFSHLISASR